MFIIGGIIFCISLIYLLYRLILWMQDIEERIREIENEEDDNGISKNIDK